jgi:hypothetical protein
LSDGHPAERLVRLSLGQGEYDEHFIQRLAFERPSCLPVSDIDPTYEKLVPVCMELKTDAGFVDALYVTPSGHIVLLEAKLWRNPEARRKVVAQILDYAKELTRWNYADLQREVSVCAGQKGNALHDIVVAAHGAVDARGPAAAARRPIRTTVFRESCATRFG